MAVDLRSSSGNNLWRGKTKLQCDPAQDDTLVRRFVIYRKIQTVWLAQLHHML
jgi:hypothetical protein